MKYLPYESLRGTPNVIVDGSATDDTVLTLSHWPRSGTPAAYQADTSAEIVLRYLAAPEIAPEAAEAEAVSNNHFDEDGCLGMFALLHPDAAWRHAERIVLASRAGDFGVVEDENALKVAATLASLARGRDDAYPHLLPIVERVLEEPDRFEVHWRAAVAQHRAGREALASGVAAIDEDAALDLAVVRAPRPVAASAVNSVTERLRVATIVGRVYQLTFRYESWVQYVTRPVAPRVDVTPVAERLNALESAPGRWVFDGLADTVPGLYLEGPDGEPAPSALSPEVFLHEVARGLERAASDPAARWDPWDDDAS